MQIARKVSHFATVGVVRLMVHERLKISRVIMELYPAYLRKFPQGRLVELMRARYGVGDMRLLTIEECKDLLTVIQKSLEEITCSKSYL